MLEGCSANVTRVTLGPMLRDRTNIKPIAMGNSMVTAMKMKRCLSFIVIFFFDDLKRMKLPLLSIAITLHVQHEMGKVICVVSI